MIEIFVILSISILLYIVLEWYKWQIEKDTQIDTQYSQKSVIKGDYKVELQISNEQVLDELEEVTVPPEQLYHFKTHPVRYSLYNDCNFDSYECKHLYKTVIVENLWIKEPFHSTFFKSLWILNKNELFIVNTESKVITSNLRDKNNKIVKVKSFEVFSTIEILHNVTTQTLSKIVKFEKNHSQDIVLAICVIAMQKSEHYLSLQQPRNLIENILDGYNRLEDVECIINHVYTGDDDSMNFIDEAFKYAISHARAHPFVDKGTREKDLQIPSVLPQKVLQHI